MTLLHFVVLFLILLFFVGGWVFLSYLLSSEMDDPDGYARITGNCGDTMELSFKVADGTVTETHHWTNGCSVSAQCVEAAARLAANKKTSEIKSINMIHIMDQVGRLPDTHVHCAQLAETTLQKAL
ncbi:MAG: iron-sulfur cluster assembly scaffold protein, partial [Desulfocapsaceae bacterium]|nr:iron-sulfur cluster assembly scaffold protein [Desulfocapsaceae bacterium]